METNVSECGCERTFINGTWIWVFCDEHEVETAFERGGIIRKFRKSVEE